MFDINNGAALLDKPELAARLKVNKRSVDRYMANGMPFYRLGYKTARFSWPAVLEWLEKNYRISARA